MSKLGWDYPPGAEHDPFAPYNQPDIEDNAFDAAERRVDATPELHPYRDILLYDWPEGSLHWEWVALSPVKEIMDWAEGIAANEDRLE